MQCVVVRRFMAEGVQLEAGDLVDTAHWRPRNREGLIDGRYLAPAPGADLEGYRVQVTRTPGAQAARKRSHTKKEKGHPRG